MAFATQNAPQERFVPDKVGVVLKGYEDGLAAFRANDFAHAKCSTCRCLLGRQVRTARNILRKEVIQPQVPLRLPCYDFTPVTEPTVVGCLLAVGAPPSGRSNSHGVTGGVYKARERIHRVMLLRDY